MRSRRALLVLLLLVLLPAVGQGENVPQLLNVQGLLTDANGDPVADGSYVASFALYETAEGGGALWQEIGTVTTTDGLFTTILGESTPLTSDIFSRTELWLGFAVAFEDEMTPRQRLTSVPYALRAPSTGDSHWYIADSVLYTDDYYGLARGGAESAVLGSNPHTMVNLGVQCTTGVAGGFELNCTIGGGSRNRATMTSATIAGGYNNLAKTAATVCGGISNRATGDYSFVGGGSTNAASAYGSIICGGDNNYATGASSFVGGGSSNIVAGSFSAILGGYSNTIAESADYSCLFGIDATLDSDSTFLVDMPHIQFGSEAFGYEFPTEDGVAGQSLVTNGSGQLSWSAAPAGGGWVDDGSSIRLSTYTDKVGIGTATPGAKLDVIGHGRINGYNPPPSGEGLELAYDYISNVGFLFSADRDASNYGSLRLDGNVGIGTSTPQSKLDVEGGAVIGSGYAGEYAAPANGLLVEGKVGVGTDNPQDVLEVKGFVRFDGGTGNGSALRFAEGGALKWALLYRPWADHKIGFWDEVNSRWAIAMEPASGEVGIGTDSPNYTLDVRGTIGNNTTLYHSDRRWKKDIAVIPDALEMICQMRGVNFCWNRDQFNEMNFPEGRHLGVIAQEVEAVAPELVHTDAEGYKSVEYANLVAVLIEAVKELRADNQTLRERIERLESR